MSSVTAGNDAENGESLMTARALQLSLTAPRCPPYYTAQRSLMMGLFPRGDRPYVTTTTTTTADAGETVARPAAPLGDIPSRDHHQHPHQHHHHHHHHHQLQHLVDRFLYRQQQHRPRRDNGAGQKTVGKAGGGRGGGPPKQQQLHPHLPSLGPDWSDRITRLLGTVLPVAWQNSCRDSGAFRSVCDTLVMATIPMAALANPGAAVDFARLTWGGTVESDGNGNGTDDGRGGPSSIQAPRRRSRIQRRRLVYGDDDPDAQFVDVLLPDGDGSRRGCRDHPHAATVDDEASRGGMVIFVHGGAWGSGKPWFYRLVALPFLKRGLAVAIVGYRVYPAADVDVQVQDVDAAFGGLCRAYPAWCGPDRHRPPPGGGGGAKLVTPSTVGTVVVGHSSGAHVALLWIVERAKRAVRTRQAHLAEEGPDPPSVPRTPGDVEPPELRFVDAFVGIAGPYNIGHHFDYEAARGLEEISPLKAANGFTRDAFARNSPVWRLQGLLSQLLESDARLALNSYLPRALLVHGIEDETVPFTATGEAAHMLRSCGWTDCDEYYVPNTSHQEAVVQLMLGGRVEDVIVNWLDGMGGDGGASTSPRSKL